MKLPDWPNTTPSRNMSSTGKKNVQNSAWRLRTVIWMSALTKSQNVRI